MTQIYQKQKEYFRSGVTLDVSWRRKQLQALYDVIVRKEKDITDALYKDLGKSAEESYMSEIGMVLSEITHMKKHLKRYSSRKYVSSPLAQFPSISYKQAVPYGNVLIMSPWNYPFLLTMDPLVCAIAAGNTAVLKPGPDSPHTNQVMKEIIRELFCEEYVCLVEGGIETADQLLNDPFDLIFFTGSTMTGRKVYEAAAGNLIPVVLELGGKSPCIVDETADIGLSAKRIVFGKYLNCGQTCVAPDYVLVHESVHDQLITEMKKQIVAQYGNDPLSSSCYGKIISKRHFTRLQGLIDQKKTIYGGRMDESSLRMEPVIMDHVSWSDPVMQEEIFGPILPVLTYRDYNEMVALLQEKPNPLALYLFTKNKELIRIVDQKLRYGGGCINDTIIHLASDSLGFGGTGESGIGKYHGKYGFEAFSHTKSIVDKKCWLDLPMRYAPYTNRLYNRLIRLFLR